MSALPILRRWLADGWRGLSGWSIGIAVVALVYLPLFPSMRSPELLGLMESLPQELVRTLGYEQITSGAGYAQATFFGLVGFVLLTLAAVTWGTEVIAGAEESGRLELTLAHGVGRVQYALEAAAAVLVRVLVVGAVAFAVIAAINGPSELELELSHLVAACLAWTGLGFLAASASLLVGALTGRRMWATSAGAGVIVYGFVVQAVANNDPDLDALVPTSPYHWAYGASPLADGFDGVGLALLWGVSAVFVAATAFALSRRDVLG